MSRLTRWLYTHRRDIRPFIDMWGGAMSGLLAMIGFAWFVNDLACGVLDWPMLILMAIGLLLAQHLYRDLEREDSDGQR